ncbi:MAG: CvpA family protein, partial [Kiloniellales bacterium]
MEELPINITDGIVVAVLLTSGVLAFAGGFIRVLLFIVSLLGAILATFHLVPVLNSLARNYIAPQFLADAVTIVTIFVAAFVIVSTIGQLISRRAKETGMGFLDRTLGFAFGLVFGAVVVSFSYLILVRLIPPDDHPEWVQEARVLPLVIYGGQFLEGLAPEEPPTEEEAVPEEGRGRMSEALTFEEALRRVIAPGKPTPAETA